MPTLPPAERRALQLLADDRGRLAVLAADQRQKLRAMRREAGRDIALEALRAVKRDIVEALGPLASAILLDPEIALPDVVEHGAVPRDAGLLVSLEVSGAPLRGGSRPATLLPDFGADGVRRVGGTAAKLLVYVRPDREDADGHNARLVRAVADECRRAHLLLVVEVLTYALPDEDEGAYRRRKPALIREAAALAQDCGAPYLKLESAGEEAACAAVTDALRVPWALLSAGVDHGTFVGQLREALAGGAAGFIAGRSLWKEAAVLDGEERRAFLAGTSRRRLEELLAVLDA